MAAKDRIIDDFRRYIGEVVLDSYLMDRLIGRGAFSWVFHGRTRDGDDVAVKILRSTDRLMATRFAREVRVLKALPASDGLVQYIADGGARDGQPLVVIEYVDGITLAEAMARRGAISQHEAVAYLIELCDALASMHALGLVHRDIKPSNVLLAPNGRTKLIDFGIVRDAQGILKLLEKESDPEQARVFAEEIDRGVIAGTFQYMAPEQLADAALTDISRARTGPQSDVYSLGVVLFELITGTKPFVIQGEVRRADQVERSAATIGAREGARQRWPGWIAPGLLDILEAALAHDPSRRPADCRTLRDDLIRFLETGTGAPPRVAAPTIRMELAEGFSVYDEATGSIERDQSDEDRTARETLSLASAPRSLRQTYSDGVLPFEIERTGRFGIAGRSREVTLANDDDDVTTRYHPTIDDDT